MNVVRWDAIVRHAHFAPAMPEGRGGGSDDNSSEASGSAVGYGRDKVEIQDTWEFQSHPENLFARESFRDVALDDGSGKNVERALDALPEPSTHAAAADALAGTLASLAIEPPQSRDFIRIRLEVRTLRLLPGQRLTATGDCAALGGWERDAAPVMNLDAVTRTWWLDFDVAPEDLPVGYKYALRGATRAADAMEKGVDRVVAPLGWIGESRDSSPGLSTGTGGGASSQSFKDGRGQNGVGTNGGPVATDGADSPISPDKVRLGMTSSDSPASDSPERTRRPTTRRRAGGRKSHHRSPSRIVARDGHFRYPGAWRGSGLAAPVFRFDRATRLAPGTLSISGRSWTWRTRADERGPGVTGERHDGAQHVVGLVPVLVRVGLCAAPATCDPAGCVGAARIAGPSTPTGSRACGPRSTRPRRRSI